MLTETSAWTCSDNGGVRASGQRAAVNGNVNALVSRSLSVIGETLGIGHRYGMSAFLHWLVRKDAVARLRLLERAEFFSPQAYNSVFESELEKLLHHVSGPEARQQVIALRGFDWGGYVERSLQRSGFKNDEVQEHLHVIAVKLLVSPGKLFSGWRPERHGPLDRRFRNSVWNAIRNLAEKERHRHRWMSVADPTVMASRYAGRAPYSSVIDDFRRLVGERLGTLAVAILDQRLEGKDTKELVGRTDLGSPSAYAIKREVAAVKDLAKKYAVVVGEPNLLTNIEQMLGREAETIAKRKAAAAQVIDKR